MTPKGLLKLPRPATGNTLYFDGEVNIWIFLLPRPRPFVRYLADEVVLAFWAGATVPFDASNASR